MINGYDEELDDNNTIAYIEEDYELADIEDNDGNTYLVEYVNEEPDTSGEIQMIDMDENLADDDVNAEYTDLLDDMIECSDTTNEIYNCNLCGMNFKNVNEHVEKYHSNEDVVIEMEDYDTELKPDQLLIDAQEFDQSDNDQISMLPDDDLEFRSTIIQMDEDGSILEGTSDIENAELYEFEASIEADDDTEQSSNVSFGIAIHLNMARIRN